MGNEVSARTKRFPLRRKKSPSNKEQPGGSKTGKAASLSSLGSLRKNIPSVKSQRNVKNGTTAASDGNEDAITKILGSSSNIDPHGSKSETSGGFFSPKAQAKSTQPENVANSAIPPNPPPNTQKTGNDGNDFDFEDQMLANSLKTKVCLDDFTLVKTVGKGSFGRVIQVKKKDSGKIYAMKVLKKEQVIKRKQFEHTMAERRILEDIDHPFIVSLRFAFQTSQKLFMVFDFFNGGELFHYLSKTGRFGEERARLYSAEILLGLEHVHSMHIIYRDLKPENLLLDSDGHIRITDFGLSKENVVDDSVKSFCGTPEYLAPEVLKRQKYGKAVDWWSLGTLLYEMITGLPPFYDRNRDRMYKKVLTAELKFPSYMTPEARSVCRGLLQRDPTQRLGYRSASEIKSHPFYSQHLNFQDVYYKKIKPKFVPTVSGIEDTRNVDKAFTSIPACVTPTPMDSKVEIDKEFTDFTFTQSNTLEQVPNIPNSTQNVSTAQNVNLSVNQNPVSGTNFANNYGGFNNFNNGFSNGNTGAFQFPSIPHFDMHSNYNNINNYSNLNGFNMQYNANGLSSGNLNMNLNSLQNINGNSAFHQQGHQRQNFNNVQNGNGVGFPNQNSSKMNPQGQASINNMNASHMNTFVNPNSLNQPFNHMSLNGGQNVMNMHNNFSQNQTQFPLNIGVNNLNNINNFNGTNQGLDSGNNSSYGTADTHAFGTGNQNQI